MSASRSKFANRRKSSIFVSKKYAAKNKSHIGKSGAPNQYRKRSSQYHGIKRYSVVEGRQINQHRDNSQNDRIGGKRENFTSDTVQIIYEDDGELSSDDSSEADYLYDDFSQSDSESDNGKNGEEKAHRLISKNNEIIVNVTVDDGHPDGPMPPLVVPCGNGENTFKWLSVVAMTRYTALAKSNGRLRSRECFHVRPGSYTPLAVKGNTSKWPPSAYISPDLNISSVLQNGDPLTDSSNI